MQITIADDGPGFSPDVIDQLGEPYITTRRRPIGAERGNVEHGGLGLGIFIAKTLLERSGARLRLANRKAAGNRRFRHASNGRAPQFDAAAAPALANPPGEPRKA